MPANSPPGPRGELAALREAVEELSHLVRLLTRALDDLTVEVQWRNNEQCGRGGRFLPDPVVSMSLDPTTTDWQVNHVDLDARPLARPTAPQSGRQTLFD